jgi:predicted nucleic acid-binding protein
VEARFLAENQQEARDAAEKKKAAIEEAKRIWRQLIAVKKKIPVQPSSSQQLAIAPNSRDQEDKFILQISEEVPEQ